MKRKVLKLLSCTVVLVVALASFIVPTAFADKVEDYTFTMEDITQSDTKITGTGVPTTKINVTANGNLISQATVDEHGNWSATFNTPLKSGEAIKAEQLPNEANIIAVTYIVDADNPGSDLTHVSQGQNIALKQRIINTVPYSKATNILFKYTYWGSVFYDGQRADSLNGPTATEPGEVYQDTRVGGSQIATADMTAEEFIAQFMAGSYANPKVDVYSYDKPDIETVTKTVQQTYKVKYDANGGTGTVEDNTPYLENAKVTVKSAKELSRKGYVFKSWNTAADGSGTTLAPKDTLTIKEDTVLYAQWTVVATGNNSNTQNENGTTAPQTSDTGNLPLYAGLMLTALAMTGVFIYKKKCI